MTDKVIYSVTDIQNILDIGRNQAYTLVNSGAFPVKKVGGRSLISKEVFHYWLNSAS